MVATLITGEASRRFGIIPWTQDEQALWPMEKVRYVGDEIACVAALDERPAEEALRVSASTTSCCPR